jgi:ubiquinone/menaquinone biosynthesis C-methylase UbiE
MGHAPHRTPPGAGKSSFDLIDPNIFLASLVLKPHLTILDLGCGQGNYTLALAQGTGPEGLVYAVDLWAEGLARLKEEAAVRGLSHIRPILADVSRPLPLEDASVDLVLLATVLHDLVEVHAETGALQNLARLLKTGGALAIVEFKKMDGPPGPPKHIRLAPDEVENLVEPYGFQLRVQVELGLYTYLMRFEKL